jgi:hypothetical protein
MPFSILLNARAKRWPRGFDRCVAIRSYASFAGFPCAWSLLPTGIMRKNQKERDMKENGKNVNNLLLDERRQLILAKIQMPVI